MSSGAVAEQILACWSRGNTANGTEGGVGGPLVGCKGHLSLAQRRRSPQCTHRGISAAGSQVGQMTLIFHSSLKHRIDLGTGKKLWRKGKAALMGTWPGSCGGRVLCQEGTSN